MTQRGSIGAEVERVTTLIINRGVEYLPSLAAALLLLLAGWIVAKLLKAAAGRLLVLLDVVVARMFRTQLRERIRLARSAEVLGTLVFWVVLLFFIAAAAHVLGIPLVTEWLARLLDILPGLVAALLIVVAGYMLSRVVADLILRTSTPLATHQRLVAARAAQTSILAATILVAAEQIGIRVTFLAIFAGIAAVAVVGGLMIAISLGARVHVANLIGAQQVRSRYLLGQRIRIGEFEGRILEVTPHTVVLETATGRAALPGRMFSENAVELLEGDVGG